MNYDDNTVISALDSLKKKGLVATATGGSSRVVKYKHNLALAYPLIPAELSVICLLLLRGPLTVGEINTNAGRMFNFESLEEVQQHLDKLAAEEPVMIVSLPKRPGQKEARYMHLLGGVPDPDDSLGNQSAALTHREPWGSGNMIQDIYRTLYGEQHSYECHRLQVPLDDPFVVSGGE